MPIRITGMNSGLDTEALVSELVSAYRKKTDKYVKAQTKLTWKQDAWKSMSAKTYSFRSSLDAMRFSKNYQMKKTSVSNATKATVTAGNNAVNGSQSLNITQLAKAGYLTGAKLNENGNVSKNTTLATLGYTGSGEVELNGTKIKLDGSMTINDAVSRFQSAGVTASFDETNQRIFISSKKSGAASDFTLIATDPDGQQALKALGLNAKPAAGSAADKLTQEYSKVLTSYMADKGITDETKVTAADLADWLKDNVEAYNKNATLISEADSAESYLQRALDYKNAINTTSGLTSTQRVLLEDGSLFIGPGNNTVNNIYKLSDDTSDPKGRYYTVNGGATHYYLTSKQATNPDGSLKVDDQGNPVMVSTFEYDDGTGTMQKVTEDVSTADEYLREAFADPGDPDKDVDAEIAKYRGALSTMKGFETAVKAEEDAYNARLADLDKKINDTSLTQEERDAAQAEKDALIAGETYTDKDGNDHKWRSLKDVSSMGKADIEAALNKVRTERGDAEKHVKENSFYASYAAEYASAQDAAAKEGLMNELAEKVKYIAVDAKNNTDYNTGAIRVDAQDAKIYLNGADYTSSSNTFEINGLTITALETTITEDELKNDPSKADSSAITITTATDSQAIYDKIKDFIGEYNDLINLMTGSYNSEKTTDYEPLTDEEKEAMTESQIEKWEEKGKSGVLRRDGTLNALMSTLTTAMARSYEIDGKNYSLSSFGIKTLGILNAEKNEHNAFHIDGDEDDDSVSGNGDKLMTAIRENPDAVITFFQALTTDISIDLGKKMSSTQMRTYGNFYNDKEMAKEYSDYTTTIAKWEDKLAKIEDSYYKKFAAMEKALATLQSQSSQLAGLLG